MNAGSDRQGAGAVLRYSNTHTSDPIGPLASQNGTAATITAPAAVTTEANSLVLRLGLSDSRGGDTPTGPLVEGAGHVNSRFNLVSANPIVLESVVFAGSDGVQPGAGSTGAATWTGGEQNWVASTISIRPPQVIVDADLSITKNDGETKVNPGDTIVYTIVAANSGVGSNDVTGASVDDIFPASLSCTWTCLGAGGASCTAMGAGNIADTVNLPVGGTVTYTASCDVDGGASGQILNTATVTAPVDVTDTDSGNNDAMDITQINQAPIAMCMDVSVNADANCVADASIDDGSNDPDGDGFNITQDPAGPYALGDTSVELTITDGLGLSDMCTATVTVVDVTDPVISCNSPATIVPPDATISFTASADDNCSVDTVAITGFACWFTNGAGKIIDKTESCVVSIDGDTVTISDSGGVDTMITWDVEASDGSGNTSTTQCSVDVINPGQN